MADTNLTKVATYMPPEVAERLRKLAEDERRTVSAMTAILVEEALKNRKR